MALDPATDHPGRRLSSFLTRAIGDLKPVTQGPQPMLDAAIPPIRKNITGASFLSEKFKQDLASAKAAIEASHVKLGEAVASVHDAAMQTTELAKAIQAEADDLRASLGQASNGAPG